LAVYLACKTLDTLAHPQLHRCKETNVRGNMDKHFYAYAN